MSQIIPLCLYISVHSFVFLKFYILNNNLITQIKEFIKLTIFILTKYE